MNRNELFQGFEEIDESLLRRSEKSETIGVKNTVIKWGLVAAFCCLTAAAAVASGFNFEKVSVFPETSVQNAATEEQTINGNEQSDLLSWQPVYNIAGGAVNALKRYIPGYYTKELTATELSAVMPDGIPKEMFYSGNAGFDGNGNLISVLLTVKSKTGQSVSVRISSDGTFRDYVFNSEAQVSKFGNTEYKEKKKKKEHENCTKRVVSCSFKSDNRFRNIKRHFEKIFIKIITVLNMPYKIDKL